LNFIEDAEDPIQATIQIEVARLHVTHYLSNEIREYSQWFRGADNNIANALYRDNDRKKLIHSTAKQDRLMADLASATAARQTAVGGNTLDNETRA
jgi:hypothetical protein